MEKIKYWIVSYWIKDETGFSTVSKNFIQLVDAFDYMTNHNNHKFTITKATQVVEDK